MPGQLDMPGMPMIPAWDQVLAFGEYQHVTVDGKPTETVFDASKCRFMLDDFSTRKNDIFVDRSHEVVDATSGDADQLLTEVDEWGQDGRALAWVDALCMVVGGVVVKYARHATAPENPPTIQDLQRPDGTSPEDGVYARRYLVTPLGADPKEGLSVFRYTSPYYIPMRDGWRLLNYTATNDPRMEGVALGGMQAMQASGRAWMGRTAMSRRGASMSRSASNLENSMSMKPEEMKRLMEAAGCKDEDKPEERLGKMTAYAAKMEDDAKKEKDASEMARKKMEDEASEMRRKMEAGEDEKRQEAARQKAESEKPKDGDKDEKAAMSRRASALEEKVDMLTKALADSRAASAAVKEFTDRAAKLESDEFASSAIAMGRIKGDHKGDVAKTTGWLAAKWLKDKIEAEDFLCAEGTFQPSEAQVMRRYVKGGSPEGSPDPRGDMSPDDALDAAVATEIKAMQAQGLKDNLTSQAMARVKQKNPALWARYSERN